MIISSRRNHVHHLLAASQGAPYLPPIQRWVALNLREVWRCHELLVFLVWRDIKVRYKQTALGAAWAVIRPVGTMLVFSLFFGRLAKVPFRRYPVPALRLLPLIPWTFFSYGLSQSSDGLVGSGNLIKKVYFLRLVIPLASVLSGIVDFCLAFAVLRGTMAYYGAMPSINILYLPGWLRSALLRTGNARRPACSPFLCSWPS